MKLTIDTSSDSHHDIRKAIRLLQSIVGENEVFTNEPAQQSSGVFDNSSPEVGGFMNMFDTPTQTESTPEPQEQKQDDIPQVEFF